MSPIDFQHAVVFGLISIFAAIFSLGDLALGHKLSWQIDRVIFVALWIWALFDYHIV